MLELLLCSLFTVVPDYLYRRYGQGLRIGREITIYSVWYILRWGITACVILTLAFITVVFYYHPATSNVTAMFRTIPILPEKGGRIAEVYVGFREEVEAGQPLFRLDSTEEDAAVETARQGVAEVDAAFVVARADRLAAEGRITEAQIAVQQVFDELETKTALQERGSTAVTQREIDTLTNALEGRQGALASARANKEGAEAQISALLPAQKARAESMLAEAQAAFDKTVVRAGVTGHVEQFMLREGDYVSPIMRPAGVLIPEGAGQNSVQAGFNQLESSVIKPGMIVEVTCISTPFTIIPMVVTSVQGVISSGQVRLQDQLIDVQATQPGLLLAFLEPLFPEQAQDVIRPGSSCTAFAYTSNHARLEDPSLPLMTWLGLHAVDAVAVVHAMILRLQVALYPVKALVLSGAH